MVRHHGGQSTWLVIMGVRVHHGGCYLRVHGWSSWIMEVAISEYMVSDHGGSFKGGQCTCVGNQGKFRPAI